MAKVTRKVANKTVATAVSVDDFIAAPPDASRVRDCRELDVLMRKATGENPRMWGANMVGFGSYHYRYQNGREGDVFLVGFAPRKTEIAIYIVPGFGTYAELMARLGKHRTGKSCLYIRRLAEIDRDILNRLIERSVTDMRARYGKGPADLLTPPNPKRTPFTRPTESSDR